MAETEFPSGELLSWYENHQRDLPWRRTGDPYHIWVSEVMLQQTRVDTVIPYYRRFIRTFPTIRDLAGADRGQVLKCWEGLGYYSRARNLQDAAKTVTEKFGGRLPDTREGILSLKGIGPYTAAAVLSIAFGQELAVVDGNVIRVLARYFGLEDDVRERKTIQAVQELADRCLDRNRPGDYNQALMELGSLICRPQNPLCGSCPLAAGCLANRISATGRIPYKSPAGKIPHHQVGVGLIVDRLGRLLIAQRPEDAMLGGLWEFPGGKKRKQENIREAIRRELREELDIDTEVGSRFMKLDHAYSHFRITLHAYWCRILSEERQPVPRQSVQIRFVTPDELDDYPFPRANRLLIDRLLEEGIPETDVTGVEK